MEGKATKFNGLQGIFLPETVLIKKIRIYAIRILNICSDLCLRITCSGACFFLYIAGGTMGRAGF